MSNEWYPLEGVIIEEEQPVLSEIDSFLRSKFVKVVLILIAVFVIIIGYVTHKPQPEGFLGWLVVIGKSYWYGFDALVSAFISDPSLTYIVAWIARWLLSFLLFYSIFRPILSWAGLAKFILALGLIASLILVILALLKIIGLIT